MKTMSLACVVAGVLAAGLHLTAAERARFKHVVSIYFDGQGAGLKLPEAVACGAGGQIVVGDTGNDRLLRFAYQGTAVSGGTEIKVPELAAPVRVQLNSKGEIYALDSMKRRIARLSPEGAFQGPVDFSGVPPPNTIVPKSFAIDSADNLYVLDVAGGRVLILDRQGQFQKSFPLPPDIGFPTDVTVGSAGTIFVIDSTKRRLLSASKDASSLGYLAGSLAEFVPTLPTAVMAAKGTIFVVEGPGSSIAAFGLDGTFLSRQLTMGWAEGALNHPSQMCINDKDEVFIADRDNSRIQVFQFVP